MKNVRFFAKLKSVMNKDNHKRELDYLSDDGHPWEIKAETSEPVSMLVSNPTKVITWGELIFGQTLPWYFSVIVWPMFILLLAEIGLRVMQVKYLDFWPSSSFTWAINILRIGLFIYLVVYAHKQFKATAKQIMAAAVLGGLLVGIVLAVFQLFWYLGELWVFFNLIGQPLLLAAEGLLISWLISKSFYKI